MKKNETNGRKKYTPPTIIELGNEVWTDPYCCNGSGGMLHGWCGVGDCANCHPEGPPPGSDT